METKKLLDLLETLMEQGFVEWAEPQGGLPTELVEQMTALEFLEITGPLHRAGGSIGAWLRNSDKAEALKRLLELALIKVR